MDKGEVMHVSKLKKWYSANEINNKSIGQSIHIADTVQ